MEEKEVKVVDTTDNKENGTNRCPKCGASDVTYDTKKKKLVCNYCYTEFEKEDIEGIEKEAKNLEGETRGSGTKDIDENIDDIITLKCSGCGAEVVINTKESTNARCHWCRSILSINSQINNGSIPDVVLPFDIDKTQAEQKIKAFVDKRKFYSHPAFKKEFTTTNIMGVYFPYMLVDAKGHGKYTGKAGHVAGSYEIVTGKDKDGNEKKETVYDIDLYDIERDFDIAIDDLTIESSKDKLNKYNKDKTTNIINSIMPFDTENCVKYKSNYLAGYTSEKRDVNISDIEEKVDKEIKDITRYNLNNFLKYYDAGVKWEQEDLQISGKQWISAYLPVWLYSYQDSKKVLHYVAVNGRTGETMGSIPINKTKLFLMSMFVFLIILLFPALIVFLNTRTLDNILTATPSIYISGVIGLIIALVFYFSKESKYRNEGARHKYEKETKSEITNLKNIDNKITTINENSFSSITEANNYKIEGETVQIKNNGVKQ